MISNFIIQFYLFIIYWTIVDYHIWAVSKKMAPTCEKNVQIKLTPKNFLLIIFNVVYIEVNETRKKLTDKQ